MSGIVIDAGNRVTIKVKILALTGVYFPVRVWPANKSSK